MLSRLKGLALFSLVAARFVLGNASSASRTRAITLEPAEEAKVRSLLFKYPVITEVAYSSFETPTRVAGLGDGLEAFRLLAAPPAEDRRRP